MPTAALGFRPHTYWTAVVALAGDPGAPEVLERRKVIFAEGEETFVYHAAESLSLPEAEAKLASVRGLTAQKVTDAVGQLLADLEAHGVEVRAIATPRGTLKVPGTIAEIVKVHTYMHAAEGHFYRDVVAEGCERLGLSVARVVEKALAPAVAARLGIDAAELEERLKAMGAVLGPPWNQDFRLATLAAWTQLPE